MLNAIFSFNGRLARLPYFLLHILFTVLMVVTAFVIAFTEGNLIVILLGAGIILALIVASFAILVRRLHDINFSAVHLSWLIPVTMAVSAIAVTFPMIELVNLGLGLWLFLAPGNDGPNNFGPRPS